MKYYFHKVKNEELIELFLGIFTSTDVVFLPVETAKPSGFIVQIYDLLFKLVLRLTKRFLGFN